MAYDREKQAERDAELDRFWDIDALLPVRRSFPRSEKSEAVEVDVPPLTVEKSAQASKAQSIPQRENTAAVVHSVSPVESEPVHRYVNPDAVREMANAPKPEDEYVPECALIHNVKIYRWRSSYQYYEEFVRTAEKLQSVRGGPCEMVKFFSYVQSHHFHSICIFIA